MNTKHQTRNFILAIAGCLILQFVAKAQGTFPITGTGVLITNPSYGDIAIIASGSYDDYTGHSYGGKLVLRAGTDTYYDASIQLSPTGDIKLATSSNFLDISGDENVTIASNGDTNLWSNREMQLISSGPLEIYCQDNFVNIHGDNGGVKIHSPYGSVHIHNLASGTAPTDAVNKSQLDAATLWMQSGTNISFSSANVGIGTTTPTHMLTVNGTIRAKEVIVDTGWADDVFLKGYKLSTLAETESYIQTNGRLPGIPSAKEVQDKGVSVGESQAMLLRKIEELTLHMIQMEKRVAELETENAALKAK